MDLWMLLDFIRSDRAVITMVTGLGMNIRTQSVNPKRRPSTVLVETRPYCLRWRRQRIRRGEKQWQQNEESAAGHPMPSGEPILIVPIVVETALRAWW
jgi:hypothetical protein